MAQPLPPSEGPEAGGLSAEPQDYTPWLSRMLAWIIDTLPFAVLTILGIALLTILRDTACNPDVSEYDVGPFCSTGASTSGQISFVVSWFLALAYVVWNYGYRQGVTGSSIGKRILKFKVVGTNSGLPVGFGRSLIRQLAHLVDTAICYVGYLFPLWDAKRQTLADKICMTVCVPM